MKKMPSHKREEHIEEKIMPGIHKKVHKIEKKEDKKKKMPKMHCKSCDCKGY